MSDEDSIIVLLAIVILVLGAGFAVTELPTSQRNLVSHAVASRHSILATR
jgi:hypothetical protein